MPGKGRRVASRQAELGKRRRRQGRVPSSGVVIGRPAAGPVSPAESSVATDVPESQTAGQRTEPPAPPRPAAAPPQRGPVRARLDRPAAYNYVVPELRRILIMAGVLLVSLIVISITVSYLV